MPRSWQPGAGRVMPVAKKIRVLDKPFERDSSVDSQVLANPSQDLK